jgi:hypothetical protein
MELRINSNLSVSQAVIVHRQYLDTSLASYKDLLFSGSLRSTCMQQADVILRAADKWKSAAGKTVFELARESMREAQAAAPNGLRGNNPGLTRFGMYRCFSQANRSFGLNNPNLETMVEILIAAVFYSISDANPDIDYYGHIVHIVAGFGHFETMMNATESGIDTRKPNSSGADYIMVLTNTLFKRLGEMFGIAGADNKQLIGNLLNATNGSLVNLTSVSVSMGNIQSLPDEDTVYSLFSATELRGQAGSVKLSDIIKLVCERGGGEQSKTMYTTIVDEQGSNKRELKKNMQVFSLSLLVVCTNCKPDKISNEEWRTLLAVWTAMCPGSGPYIRASEKNVFNDMEFNQFQGRALAMLPEKEQKFMATFMIPFMMARAYIGIFNKVSSSFIA